MKRKGFFSLLLVLAGAVVWAEAPSPAHIEGSVRSITLPTYLPVMPPGPSLNYVLNNCTMCHSGRYILMQPALPRSKWKAEVEKMHKAFGCPIDEASQTKVVNYLNHLSETRHKKELP